MAAPVPPPKIVVGQRYKATAAYAPVHSDEVRLALGHVITVLHSYDDGWVLGKNETTMGTGLLPGNFLASLDAPDVLKAEQKVADKRKSSMQPFTNTSGNGAASRQGSVKRERNALNGSPPLSPPIDTQEPEVTSRFTAPDFPSGRPAGPVEPPSTATLNGTDKEEASRKLKEVLNKKNPRFKVPANIGSLRIMIVGDSGIGKTALIQAFFKTSEIVETASPKDVESFPGLSIVQSMASTIPANQLHIGEDHLNITFFEPPGFGAHTDAMRVIRPTAEFNTLQFQKTDRVFVRDKAIPTDTILRFLNSGNGAHTHIDVCIYAVLHRLKAVDLEYMRQLAPGVVLVPVILKSDTMKPEEVMALKVSILEETRRAGIDLYGFGLQHQDLLQIATAGVQGAIPFAVSVVDDKPKDSVNEFEQLKEHVFYRAQELRQQTAENFVNWRATNIQ
ncbi:Septin-domain-containing protein [Fimicolochytrium jonesii]|uniref:Septin-domain-containing protein n=1 Tax=Fimicolochytrium jonesii TaxID=1396493 RepID=UPI0022FF2768|nr:Septin-domain-containing protein [Fimicolochytrium jonesii]KAI8823583.1 Septin-domain-containing protein [Fimicolochytrium jonesii]